MGSGGAVGGGGGCKTEIDVLQVTEAGNHRQPLHSKHT